jgi:hypothetical protein
VSITPQVKQANNNGVEVNNNRIEKGSVSEGAITVKDGAFKGVEIKFGSTGPVVNMPISAPLMQNNFRKMIWNEAVIENESYEYEYFPNGKPAYYKHTLPPAKNAKAGMDAKLFWLIVIPLWMLVIFFSIKWFGKGLLLVAQSIWALLVKLGAKIKNKK